MEMIELPYLIGDIINVDGNLYLWFGENYLADANGLPTIFSDEDMKRISKATSKEAWSYFSQLQENGLKWNSNHRCFEVKESNTLKFHGGDIAINEYGRQIYIYGVCYDDNVLCYLRKLFGTYYTTPVDKLEHEFFTETEVNTLPKRKYRIVKVSDKNGMFCDRFYIQERKFGFLWLYIDEPFGIEWIMKYSLAKGDAKFYSTMESASDTIFRLRLEELQEMRGKERCKNVKKTKFQKEILPVGDVKIPY